MSPRHQWSQSARPSNRLPLTHLFATLIVAFALALMGASNASAVDHDGDEGSDHTDSAEPESSAPVSQYWIYFNQSDGDWALANKGPAQTKPADGSVEGYRFAAPKDFTKPNLPRTDDSVTFESVCKGTPPQDGKKRVAVVVDYGVDSDARDGQSTPAPVASCSQVNESASGLQVLQGANADARIEKNSVGESVCGIGGYPSTGCFEEVDTATPADEEPVDFEIALVGRGEGQGEKASGSESASDSDDSESNWGLIGGVGVIVVLLAAGGIFLSRRNSAA